MESAVIVGEKMEVYQMLCFRDVSSQIVCQYRQTAIVGLTIWNVFAALFKSVLIQVL